MIRASNLPRVAACPGAHVACLGIREQRSEAADAGTKMHRACETGDAEALDARETKLVERALAAENALKDRFVGDAATGIFREQQIYYNRLRLSGKIDKAYVTPKVGLIVDYKFGTWAVDDADTNLQLRAYGVLFAGSRLCPDSVERIYMAIIQPTVTDEPVVVEYTREDLRKAYAEIDRYVTLAMSDNPPRRPSEHCKFCPAAGTARCPESAALIKAPELPLMIEAAVLGQLLGEWKRVESIGTALEKIAKERMLAGEQIPGWELKDNAPRSKVKDVMQAWAGLEDLLTAKQFAEACGVSLGKLEAAYREETGCTWPEAKDQVRSRLAGVIEKTDIAPSIVKVKGQVTA